VLPWLAGLTTFAALVLAGFALYVGWRRGAAAGVSLAVLLTAAAWWGVFYAVELSIDTNDLATRSLWGDVKYVGVCVLPAAWLAFALQYTGRGHLVSRKVLAVLTAEPLIVLALLAIPNTHNLVHYYPLGSTGQELPVVKTGWVFWVHFAYAYALIFVGMVVFVATMVGLARTYRRMAFTLVGAALLPWIANALHNYEVGPFFTRLDLTPFLFVVTGGVLVWGVFRERLLNLSPLARGVIVDTMTDAVFVLDAFGRVVEVNPAGSQVLGGTRPELIGRRLNDLLPQQTEDPSGEAHPPQHGGELSLGDREFDVRRQPLTDRNARPAGELVVLRDITERVLAERHLQGLLVERSRVAAALQASLVPGELPGIPAAEVASRYEPAGDGGEIGGDFFDVFPLGAEVWGLVLGDVSGKGAEAAAVTALARYTLRTLARATHRPSRTLRELNARLLAATDVERHCTLVYAIARPHPGGLELMVSLAGHHPPLVLRADGTVEPVGKLGTALGLIADPELSDARVFLGAGDLLCMFTDGLVEARDGSDLFGTDRVAALLAEEGRSSVDEIAAQLVAAARSFHGGRDLTDDLALLMLRVDADAAARHADEPGVTRAAPRAQAGMT
jgi:PAS domain S-box-containing protein